MRLVFQFPASITSVVDAPRVVSSDAKPTRPECAVTRLSTPATADAAVNRNPTICGDNGTTRSAGSGTRGGAQRPERARDTVLDEPHVVHLALLIRFTSADGDEHPVAVGRIGDVGPAQRADLAAPHPGHEQQSGDHRIDPPPLEGNLVGLDAPPATPRPVARGEHGRQIRDPERPRLSSPPITGGPPVAGPAPGPSVRRPGSVGRRASRGSTPRRPPSRRSRRRARRRAARRGNAARATSSSSRPSSQASSRRSAPA